MYAEADEAAEAARARLLQSQEDDLFYSDDRSQGGRVCALVYRIHCTAFRV